jgi:APA family basic amino acid/polyamine antiporter
MILSGARVYYAMAKDNLFFKAAGNLNKHGVPARGLVIQCVWAIILCLSGSYSNLLDYVIATVLIFYALTIAGVFILRRRQTGDNQRLKSIGYPVLPAIYIVSALFITIILLIYKPYYSWPGMIIILSGIPVYYIWKRIGSKQSVN